MKTFIRIKTQTIKTSLGEIVIGECYGKLCLCLWARHSKRAAIEHRTQRLLKLKFEEEETQFLQEAAKQIREFITHMRTTFTLETMTVGTDFQQDVWRKMEEIAYGQTRTFKQLAESLQMEDSLRPISAAVGSNPLQIICPNHRLISETRTPSSCFDDHINATLRRLEKETIEKGSTQFML